MKQNWVEQLIRTSWMGSSCLAVEQRQRVGLRCNARPAVATSPASQKAAGTASRMLSLDL